MRKRLPFIIGLATLGTAAVCLYFCRPHTPSLGTIKVVGYQAYSNCLVASVVITNTGFSPLSFWDGAAGVWCAVSARVRGAETNFEAGVGVPFSMSWEEVVWPSSGAHARILLPLGIDSWSCSISTHGPSARIKAATRMMESGLWDRIYPVSQWSLRFFSLKRSAGRQIESATFQVATNTIPLNPELTPIKPARDGLFSFPFFCPLNGNSVLVSNESSTRRRDDDLVPYRVSEARRK